MNEQEFKDRTKKLGLRVIRLVEALPKSQSAQVIGKQILRAATSVGANYRAACRAKSAADILNKLKKWLKRKRTKPFTGWNFSLRPNLYPKLV